MIWGLDIATRCTGWCAGDGAQPPETGVLLYDHVGEDLGLLGMLWRKDLTRLEQRFGRPDHIIYERPILLPHDKCLPLRKIYGMGMILEVWASDRPDPIPVHEVTLQEIKTRVTGSHKAKKPVVVAVVSRLGVMLPDGKMAEDAADAFGAWLTGGVDHYARQHQAMWDGKLYRSRGRLM